MATFTHEFELLTGGTIETAGSMASTGALAPAGSRALTNVQVPVGSQVSAGSVASTVQQASVSIHSVPSQGVEVERHRALEGYTPGSAAGSGGMTHTYPMIGQVPSAPTITEVVAGSTRGDVAGAPLPIGLRAHAHLSEHF